MIPEVEDQDVIKLGLPWPGKDWHWEAKVEMKPNRWEYEEKDETLTLSLVPDSEGYVESDSVLMEYVSSDSLIEIARRLIDRRGANNMKRFLRTTLDTDRVVILE